MSSEKLKLTALELNPGTATPIRPSKRDRKWMDETPVKYAYRCLPMVIANQFGWDLLSTHRLKATWDGTVLREGLKIEMLHGDGQLAATSHFGSGILTFTIPFLFKTPPGWNLMVRGPANAPKDGIVALDGIVETDWSHATFTMNWKFTRACTVEFDVGEPISTIFPIERGHLEKFEPEIAALASERELHVKYAEWSAGRGEFIEGLDKRDEKFVKEGWEKDYFRAGRETKLTVPEFIKK